MRNKPPKESPAYKLDPKVEKYLAKFVNSLIAPSYARDLVRFTAAAKAAASGPFKLVMDTLERFGVVTGPVMAPVAELLGQVGAETADEVAALSRALLGLLDNATTQAVVNAVAAFVKLVAGSLGGVITLATALSEFVLSPRLWQDMADTVQDFVELDFGSIWNRWMRANERGGDAFRQWLVEVFSR